MSIFVCGALHLDVIVSAPRLPRLDETLVGQDVRYALGGKGGNQAVMAARLGAKVAMAGAIGDDRFADDLLASLANAGVDTAQVQRLSGPSGMSVAILDLDGNYGAVIVSAANLALNPSSINLPKDTRILLLQNEIPEAANLAPARLARALGAKVVFNAAPARSLAPDLLALTDILVVNRVEALDLTGNNDPARALGDLAKLGPAQVIITLGADGLVMLEDGRISHHPGHEVDALSTHGAGDGFLGALAVALDGGATLQGAASFAQAAAALHVSTPPENRAAISADRVRAYSSP
ncbi:MAG: ribokinase [Albidovulum sp.]